MGTPGRHASKRFLLSVIPSASLSENLTFGVRLYLFFPGGSDGKASAYSARDPGSIPGLGRSPGKEVATHSSTLAWKIPWTEEPDRLQFMGSERV